MKGLDSMSWEGKSRNVPFTFPESLLEDTLTGTYMYIYTVYLQKILQDKNNYCRVLPKQIEIKLHISHRNINVPNNKKFYYLYAVYLNKAGCVSKWRLLYLGISILSCVLVETVVHGYYVYKVPWEPRVGETFIALHEINSK